MSHKIAAVCLLMSCLIATAYSAAKVSFRLGKTLRQTSEKSANGAN